MINFLVKLPEEDQDEILAYNEILDILQDQYEDEQSNPDQKWIFKRDYCAQRSVEP